MQNGRVEENAGKPRRQFAGGGAAQKQLTQAELARRSGVPQSHISTTTKT